MFLAAIKTANDQDMSFEELFKANDRFRYDVHRLLELNNIDLRWVSMRQLTTLLLFRQTDAGVAPGLLVEINTPQTVQQETAEREESFGQSNFFWDSIVALSTFTNDVNAAIDLSKKLNSKYLEDLALAQQRFQSRVSKAEKPAKPAERKFTRAELDEMLDKKNWTRK